MTQPESSAAVPCASKDIHFLKSDPQPERPAVAEPSVYLSDLLIETTAWIEAFLVRLTRQKIGAEAFLCLVFTEDTMASKKPATGQEPACRPALEDLDSTGQGCWGRITETVFAAALWNVDPPKALDTAARFRQKLMQETGRTTTMGGAWYPFRDFPLEQILHNAIKAYDHAAFFGSDSLIFFDDNSLNISGDRLYQRGLSTQAMTDYLKGLELNPENQNLLNSLGVCYGETGRFDQALESFERILSINPDDTMALYNAGLTLSILGQTDRALTFLGAAVRNDDTLYEAALKAGEVAGKAGDMTQARAFLAQASRLNKAASAPFSVLGDLLLRIGNPDAAIPEFKSAVKLNPANAAALAGLAAAYEMKGTNLDIALSFARESVSLDPSNTDFQERLNRLCRIMDLPVDEGTTGGDIPVAQSSALSGSTPMNLLSFKSSQNDFMEKP